jgi:membrane-associated protease RseP (regulator of RpoE activity)
MRAAAPILALLLALPGFLPGADDEYPVGRARFGAFLVPVPLDVQAVDDLLPGQGMMVVATRPGGTAATLGLQAGDVVTALNGTPINHWGDVRSVVRGVQAGDSAQVQVATSGGGTAQLNGTFQPRQPGRWWPGGPPPGPLPGMGDMAPPASAADQMRDILAEQNTLGDLGQAITALRATLDTSTDGGAPDRKQAATPWAVEVAIDAPPAGPAADAPPPAAPPAPVSDPGLSWAVEIAVGNPASP